MNRVLGYSAFKLGDAFATHVPGLRWLRNEHWVFYSPKGDAPRDDLPRATARSLLEKVCCPTCHGPLPRALDAGALECARCQRWYAIEDGVPNLLPHEAVPIARR